MAIPINNPVQVTLAEYLQLIWDSTPKIISQRNYTIINQERANIIKQAKDWDSVVVIEDLTPEEILEFKNLGIIHVENLENVWYKMTRATVWIESYKLEISRKMEQSMLVKQLCQNERRVKDGIGKLRGILGLDFNTAETMMKDYILRGKMDDIAKLLEIQDLVKK